MYFRKIVQYTKILIMKNNGNLLGLVWIFGLEIPLETSFISKIILQFNKKNNLTTSCLLFV